MLRRELSRPATAATGLEPDSSTHLDRGRLASRVNARPHARHLSAVMIWSSPSSASLIHIYSTATWSTTSGYSRYFGVPEPVHRLDADPGARRQPAGDLHRLGRRRPVLVPAHRLLVQNEANAYAGRKAFVVNRIGDFGFLLGMFLIFVAHRRRSTYARSLGNRHVVGCAACSRSGAAIRLAYRRRHPAVPRCHRQARAAAALRLAARRDGRPDAGLRAHPRRHDGHRRRLHGRRLPFLFVLGAGDAR